MRIREIARIGGFPCGEYNAVTDAPAVMTGRQSKTARKFRIIKSHILDMNIKKGLS